MARIGVVKGQPFRFGTFLNGSGNQESSTIHFISDSSNEQSKVAAPISQVEIGDAFLSADLALCKLLFKVYSEPLLDAHAADLWKTICPNTNTVVFASRQYLSSQIQSISPEPLDDARQKLECRKLLADLESGWNSSIVSPEFLPALFCAHGWNARTDTLHTMPYRALPIGRVESVGSPATSNIQSLNERESHGSADMQAMKGTTGLVYRSEPYEQGSFNVDLTASESFLSKSSDSCRIYLIYVDSLSALQPEAVWPDLLSGNISEVLSRFIKDANILVIDSVAKVKRYERALDRRLEVANVPFDHALPCCSTRQQDVLGRLRVDILSFTKKIQPEQRGDGQLRNPADLAAITRAFSDLYPAFSHGDSIPSAIIAKAFSLFEYSPKDQTLDLTLLGRCDVPIDSQSPSALYMAYGQLRVLLERLIEATSQHLVIRRSDLDKGRLIQGKSDNANPVARLILTSTKGDCSSCIDLGLDSALDILRKLCSSSLENPYKLLKLVDIDSATRAQQDDSSLLTIVVLEDY